MLTAGPWVVIPDPGLSARTLGCHPGPWVVIPDLIRDPVPRAPRTAGHARNDTSVCNDTSVGNDTRGPHFLAAVTNFGAGLRGLFRTGFLVTLFVQFAKNLIADADQQPIGRPVSGGQWRQVGLHARRRKTFVVMVLQ